MAARCARAHREDSARPRGLHPGQFAAECLRCQFAPMAARFARAHRATSARPRPSAWAVNSRPRQLASLVLIEPLTHVRGPVPPLSIRGDCTPGNSCPWQLAIARAHRTTNARPRRRPSEASVKVLPAFSKAAGCRAEPYGLALTGRQPEKKLGKQRSAFPGL